MNEDKLILFNNKKIRSVWFAERWWFVVEDIIFALADSKDPKQYIQKLKQRDEVLAEGWVQIVHTLLVQTEGGKQQMNCADKEGIFRIIQSIPSKKAEPFKRWLAKVGSERIDEIENPELAQDRAKKYYEKKGYPKDWIEKRMRGIAVRQDLTAEWKNRGIDENREYAILTTEISKNEDSTGFNECLDASVRGGNVAGKARKDAEKEIGKPILSDKNNLNLTKISKIKIKSREMKI